MTAAQLDEAQACSAFLEVCEMNDNVYLNEIDVLRSVVDAQRRADLAESLVADKLRECIC
jgi:hypothetical protein